MTAEDDNSRFIAAAQTEGMLTEQLANELLSSAGDTDTAATLALQRGFMDARQVDIIQTLVSRSQSIPGYTIIDLIGHGGMGVVFRARQETLDREVALKTILVGGRVDEAIQRFKNEATNVARLNHPNIVTAFDSGQHEGRIFLSMELVNGEDLTDYVKHHGKLAPEEALGITRQAAIGLAHAWEHGIVHRDIKPDNLLITVPSEFDQSRTVKIADLGLAQLNTDSEAARITQTGATVGSPLYMAPEQLSSSKADCRTDIYSLGSTLYFMLSGRAPFVGNSVAAVLYNKAAGSSPPLAEVADVDDRVASLVTWMMRTDPSERPQNYRAVVTEIDAIIGASSSKADAADLEATQNLTTRRPPEMDAALLQTAIVGADGSPEPTSQLQKKRARKSWLIAAATGALLISIVAYRATQPSGVLGTPIAERIVMERTWAAALFDGQSQDRWDARTPGTQWEVKPDPEGAFALAVTARENKEASIRARISELASANAL